MSTVIGEAVHIFGNILQIFGKIADVQNDELCFGVSREYAVPRLEQLGGTADGLLIRKGESDQSV